MRFIYHKGFLPPDAKPGACAFDRDEKSGLVTAMRFVPPSAKPDENEECQHLKIPFEVGDFSGDPCCDPTVKFLINCGAMGRWTLTKGKWAKVSEESGDG